jgi:hypothetical protein
MNFFTFLHVCFNHYKVKVILTTHIINVEKVCGNKEHPKKNRNYMGRIYN